MDILQATTDFQWINELLKIVLSFASGLALLLIGRRVLVIRDREIQELDRKRVQWDELRNNFIRIENNYYKVRKRYTTMFDAVKANNEVRNPYIMKMKEKLPEKFDSLLVECISLEAEYYTLMERLNISFHEVWDTKLAPLMKKKEGSVQALEDYFDSIRDNIEQEKDIDKKIREPMKKRLQEILKEFNEYESQLLPKWKIDWKRIFFLNKA